MNKREIRLKYNVPEHSIDINTLANSLSAFSDMVYETSRALGNKNEVSVNVIAHKPGSFQVDINLLLPLAVTTLFKKENLSCLANLIKVLETLFKLRKFSKGKRLKAVKKVGDKVVAKNHKNETTTVNNYIFNIYSQNTNINTSLTRNFDTLKNDPNIASFEVHKDGALAFSAAKTDFSEMSSPEHLREDADENVAYKNGARLHITKAVFTKDYKWGFYYDGQKIHANVQDKAFLKSIEDGKKFSKGDVLIVDLEIDKVFNKSVNTFIDKAYRVVKVVNHIANPEQENLPFS